MKEPVVIINGVSTKKDNVIPYTGVLNLDVEIFKTELMKDIAIHIKSNYGWNMNISYILNNISIDAYRYVFCDGTNNTAAILGLANVIFYQLQLMGVYIPVNDLVASISKHVTPVNPN